MSPTTLDKAPLWMFGKIVMTRGVADLVEAYPSLSLDISRLLSRHFSNDWGDLDSHDIKVNTDAFRNGGRLMSSYSGWPVENRTIWIITDGFRNVTSAADDPTSDETYTVTTVLLPEEY